MPRKKVINSSDFPYSISARCLNKEWFKIPLNEVWEIMEDYLYILHHGFNFKIKSFVLMSNHFHLIAQTPDGNLGEGMNYFMRETSKHIGRKAGRINQVYGSRFYRTLITNPHYYNHAYKYIYRNPVEAGLCECVLNYPYSTLNRLTGRGHLHIPIQYDDILFESFDQTIEWLNQKPSEEDYLLIRSALKKREFKLARVPTTKKTSRLEVEKY
jgi:putative transposase